MQHIHSHQCAHSCHLKHEATSHKVRLLWSVLILVSCFSLVELGVSFWSHSLALQAESGHMISDSFALGISLLAAWSSQFKISKKVTFANLQVEAIAALLNGFGLIAIAVWIAWEAIARLQSPPEDILSLPMLVTAGLGLGVNSLNVMLLHDSSHHDLNMRGAMLHIMADVISSIGVILAAIAVWLMHWLWVDGAIGLFVSCLIFLSAIPLIIQSLNVIRN